MLLFACLSALPWGRFVEQCPDMVGMEQGLKRAEAKFLGSAFMELTV